MRGCWGQNEARGKTPVESEHPFPKGIKWATLNKSAQINVVEKEGSDTSRSLHGSLFFCRGLLYGSCRSTTNLGFGRFGELRQLGSMSFMPLVPFGARFTNTGESQGPDGRSLSLWYCCRASICARLIWGCEWPGAGANLKVAWHLADWSSLVPAPVLAGLLHVKG